MLTKEIILNEIDNAKKLINNESETYVILEILEKALWLNDELTEDELYEILFDIRNIKHSIEKKEKTL